jgi:hypothetical protein
MFKLTTPLQLYRVLPKSNCRDCGASTCLAFAAAVIKEEKRLSDCPHLDKSVLAEFDGKIERQINLESIQEETLKELKAKIANIDLASRAERLGAMKNGDAIILKCLGRDFEVDSQGNVLSQCHSHPWFTIPLLHYILFSKGAVNSGKWVPFRELEHGKTWNPLFERKCEQPLKQLADNHADLFEDLIHIFSGMSSVSAFASDISVILSLLPNLPMMVCYWKPEDGMESRLHLFFDDRAEENLLIESIYSTCMGIVRMLEKIIQKHAGRFQEPSPL